MKSHSNHSNHSNVPVPAVKKQCYFCTTNAQAIDYKDNELLKGFTNPQARILPKRRTGLCATHQRMLSHSIKRARALGIIPFTIR